MAGLFSRQKESGVTERGSEARVAIWLEPSNPSFDAFVAWLVEALERQDPDVLGRLAGEAISGIAVAELLHCLTDQEQGFLLDVDDALASTDRSVRRCAGVDQDQDG